MFATNIYLKELNPKATLIRKATEAAEKFLSLIGLEYNADINNPQQVKLEPYVQIIIELRDIVRE